MKGKRKARTRPELALLSIALACCADSIAAAPVVALSAKIVAGRSASADAAGIHFTRESGETITLRRARATISSIELFPCPTTAERLLDLLSPIGVASAHGVSTERRMAAPRVLDLLASDMGSVGLGRLLPTAGSYCYAHVVFGPADADGASESGLPEMAGWTLDLAGDFRKEGAQPSQFLLSSSAVRGIDLDLDPLVVGSGANLELNFNVNYGAWLDGVDLDASNAGDQVVAQIARAVSR